jgi:hypothetical protein
MPYYLEPPFLGKANRRFSGSQSKGFFSGRQWEQPFLLHFPSLLPPSNAYYENLAPNVIRRLQKMKGKSHRMAKHRLCQ